jgi:hypothetical protein
MHHFGLYCGRNPWTSHFKTGGKIHREERNDCEYKFGENIEIFCELVTVNTDLGNNFSLIGREVYCSWFLKAFRVFHSYRC